LCGHYSALHESGFQIIGQIFSGFRAVAEIHAVLSRSFLQDKAESFQLVTGGLKSRGVVHGGKDALRDVKAVGPVRASLAPHRTGVLTVQAAA
jgi:hypothetical protein